jgi:mono/diheme cytochrome c family protein
MSITSQISKPRSLNTFGALLLSCAVGTLDAAAQAAPSFTGDPASGSQLFLDRGCVRCHSIWGNGGTLGPDFAVVGAGRSLQQLAGVFWNHTPRMIETVRERGVEWPTFSEAELADIISYIYYVKLFDEPGDPDLGERWFSDKRCEQCHTLGGKGGRIGPPLDRYARYIAPITLAQGLWNHGPVMQEQQSSLGVPMPTYVGAEIADMQAYIRRVSRMQGRDVVLLEPPDPNSGQRLFASKGCVQCHGTNGRGTAYGSDLRAATQQLRVSEIAGELLNHSSRMAAAMRARSVVFPRFRGTEMADVIAFLYYLRFYDMEGDAGKGLLLFVQKGCVGCHPEDGQSSIGPDLSQSRVVLTPLGLATAMWDHAPAMYDQIQSADADWPRFEDDEMRDLSVYLRTLASTGR